MAAAYEQHLVAEEDLLSLRELAERDPEETDSADRAVAADLTALLRMVADLDEEGRALCVDELAWLKNLEDSATRSEKNMASDAADILRGAAVLETRPGEGQAAAELRRQAAQCRARVEDAGRIAAAAHRLREKETRRMAAMERVVDPNVMAVLARVAGEMDRYASLAVADGGGCAVGRVRPEAVAAAAGAADRVEEKMERLELWFRLASLDCERRPAVAALAAPLRMQADKANAVGEAVRAFRASMRRYQVAAGIAPLPEDEEEGSEDDDMTA